MAKQTSKHENPLLGKNIPAPPVAEESSIPLQEEQGIPLNNQTSIPVLEQNEITVSRQQRSQAPEDTGKTAGGKQRILAAEQQGVPPTDKPSITVPGQQETTVQRQQSIQAAESAGKTEEGEQGMLAAAQKGNQAPSQEKEKASVELSLYLTLSQDDKLEDLKRDYKRQTRKKISSNQILRRLIDRATLDDLLPEG